MCPNAGAFRTPGKSGEKFVLPWAGPTTPNRTSSGAINFLRKPSLAKDVRKGSRDFEEPMTVTHPTDPSLSDDGNALEPGPDSDRGDRAENGDREPKETLGQHLRRQRERRNISTGELARVTRIPLASIDAIEGDRFDELPGEVFVRGFLRAHAQAIGLLPAEVLARYTSSRRVVFVTPLPMQTPLQAARDEHGRRFGVAIAFVLLLILLSLALSIALRPRGRDMPSELSQAQVDPGAAGI